VPTRRNSVRRTVSRKKPDKPKFWIVAGPNGSGKSSIYTDTDIEDFGGSVPATKMRQRRERSLQQLPWFLRNADLAWIFDNSGAKPAQIARKIGNTIILDPAALPEIKEAARLIKSMK
jgi:predicted ABC-type ATPase